MTTTTDAATTAATLTAFIPIFPTLNLGGLSLPVAKPFSQVIDANGATWLGGALSAAVAVLNAIALGGNPSALATPAQYAAWANVTQQAESIAIANGLTTQVQQLAAASQVLTNLSLGQ